MGRVLTVGLLPLLSAGARPDTPRWQIVDASGPSPRWEFEMVYDTARQAAALFSGLADYGTGDTWERQGGAWTLRAPSGPEGRFSYGMAYDEARGVTVLFGGRGDSGNQSDTWEWDGNHWSFRTAGVPSQRYWHAMAYDTQRSTSLLFGGWGEGTHYDELWEWNGSQWQLLDTGGEPSGRNAHAMAYDSTRGVLVLFGGVGADAVFSRETWEWDGADWALRATDGPPARCYHAMVFDPIRGVTMLVGGAPNISGVPSFADTWEWNGENWSQAGNVPYLVVGAALAFDSGRGVPVLFGGYAGSGPSGYTLEYRVQPGIPTVGGIGLVVLILSLLSVGGAMITRRRVV